MHLASTRGSIGRIRIDIGYGNGNGSDTDCDSGNINSIWSWRSMCHFAF
ncbi:hypothetical protein KR093_010727 [Drosophila rubida]|uniref:Uncharacterized protein n=1 Tax=Drosophila rubida TaxID=30044 RepID=A0AAD4PQS4_9MUSC|nr:hypothetical protein KR093_010727 [Drosophila rubida]